MRLINRLGPLAIVGMLVGLPAHAATFGEIAVVTHIDLIPNSAGQAPPAALTLLKQFVLDSRKDPGVESFQLITWSPTTNHFQLLELFRDRRSFEAHVSAKHSVDFRNQLQQYIGAPYDERLYRPVF